MENKLLGRIGLSMAINYFTLNGYTVSLPINDTQWYDLIVEKDGQFKTVQCKCTDTKSNTIDLRSKGGTKGSVYDVLVDHPNLDYLFCVDSDRNLFLIPINDLIEKNIRHSISLRTKSTSNGQGFQTYVYLVS